jgi:predicted DNA-binding transcriptional regulator AlpA
MSTFECLITKAELARRTQVSISCVDRWMKTRRIPVYLLGAKCVRFDYQEVRAALSKFEQPAFRRFPRQVYRCRKRLGARRLKQLLLPLLVEDPRQLRFPFQ